MRRQLVVVTEQPVVIDSVALPVPEKPGAIYSVVFVVETPAVAELVIVALADLLPQLVVEPRWRRRRQWMMLYLDLELYPVLELAAVLVDTATSNKPEG